MAKIQVEIKKEGKKVLPKERLRPGAFVRDIKANKTRLSNYKEPLPSRVIEIREEKEKKPKPKKQNLLKLIIAAAVAVFILCLFLIYFFFLVKKEKPLLRFVPRETISFVYLDLDKFLGREKKTNSLISKFVDPSLLQKEAGKFINKKILHLYDLDFEEDLAPILGKSLLLAFYFDDNKKEFVPFFAFEAKSKEDFEKSLKKIKSQKVIEENLEEFKIKTASFKNASLNFSFVLVDNTVIVSKEKKMVEKAVRVYKTKSGIEKKPVPFWEIFNPEKDFLQIYLNLEDLSQKDILKLSKTLPIENIFSFLKQNKKIFLELKENKEGLVFFFQSGLSHKAESRAGRGKEKNKKDLLSFLPKETAFVILGFDLREKYLELREENPEIKNFEIELEERYRLKMEDLLPVFSDEFAFIAPDANGFVLLLKMKDGADEILPKIEKGIQNYFARLSPREVKMKLSDQSEAIELLPDAQAFKFEDEDFEGIKIRKLKDKEKKTRFSFGQKEDLLVFAPDEERIKKVFEAKEKLSLDPNFKKISQKVSLQKMENVVYFDVFPFLGFVIQDKKTKEFFKPARSFIFGTRTDERGTFGRGFLLVEKEPS